MKAILEFDLDNPEDVRAHLRCVKSMELAIVLFDIAYNVRKRAQHICDADEKADPVQVIYDEITELLQEKGIYLDELVN